MGNGARRQAGREASTPASGRGYIADFACIEAKLIVEVDGLSHDDAMQRAYDETRTRALEAAGWRVLRVRDADVLTNAPAIERVILAALRR